MSDAELDGKMLRAVCLHTPFVGAAGLIAAVRGIEGVADPTQLMRLMVPA
jgi:hypothetical protein